ncbi:DUF3289 family protein [Photobacterium indicum]|uniref:DUF3289 family protein n=1 Tax=Photobacterium indicum TaxID=81447 RepID=UPI003D0E7861
MYNSCECGVCHSCEIQKIEEKSKKAGTSTRISAPTRPSPEFIAQAQSQLRTQDALRPTKSLNQRLSEQRLKLREESGYNDPDGRESGLDDWRPIKAKYPLLVFETQHQMNDTSVPDMIHGDESRQKIESYGFMLPFKNKMRYSPSQGQDVLAEDQFTLPASEHFKRMRDLGDGLGFSMLGDTSNVFSKMVDKFERNEGVEGGYFRSFELDKALQRHSTTKTFNAALMKCLGRNLNNGILSSDITSKTSPYLTHVAKVSLPKFGFSLRDITGLLNGTVLTVHDVWAVKIYADKLEYKDNQVRGTLSYEIQDHFGLDTADINHPSLSIKPLLLPYEQSDGFRSWYLLQHFKGYNFQPFITQIYFDMVS